MWMWFLELCWYFQLLVDKFKHFFFLFVIMKDSSKWGTDPNFSDILTSSPNLTQFWRMFPFFTPWKHQKNFWFSGVFRGYKNGSIGQKWVKKLTEVILIYLWLPTVSMFSTLSYSPLEIEFIAKKLGYLNYHVILDTRGIVKFSISHSKVEIDIRNHLS